MKNIKKIALCWKCPALPEAHSSYGRLSTLWERNTCGWWLLAPLLWIVAMVRLTPWVKHFSKWRVYSGSWNWLWYAPVCGQGWKMPEPRGGKSGDRGWAKRTSPQSFFATTPPTRASSWMCQNWQGSATSAEPQLTHTLDFWKHKNGADLRPLLFYIICFSK